MIFYCSPPSGTVVCVVFCFPQVPFPPVIPPAVIGSSPPSGTGGLDAALRGLDAALRGLDAALRGLDAALRRLDAALRRLDAALRRLDAALRRLDAALRRLDAALRRLDAALRRFYYIQVSQVTSGPRRGPIFNNRWWNDHRSWNLRTTNSREKASPKGGEPHPVLLLFAPFGDDKRVSVAIRRFHSLRSFHPRLFTFAPFGDGRMLLATLQLIYFLNA